MIQVLYLYSTLFVLALVVVLMPGRQVEKNKKDDWKLLLFFRCSWTFLQRDRAREAFSLLSGRRARDTRTRRRWDSSPKRASRMSVGTRHLCPMPPCPHLRPTFVNAQLFVNKKRGGAREKEKKGRKKVARSCGGLRAKSLCQQRIEVIARHERDRVPASYLNLSFFLARHSAVPVLLLCRRVRLRLTNRRVPIMPNIILFSLTRLPFTTARLYS